LIPPKNLGTTDLKGVTKIFKKMVTMATVNVIDVRHSEVCLSDGKRFKAFTNVKVLYK
jgi:hypothetical protein